MRDPEAPAALIVVGGASLDVLHLREGTVRSAGGAGLYTSLAASRQGARVTMVAPRPDPVPPELQPALGRLDWRGPRVPPEELPSFEIAHLGEGRSEMRSARWRAEARLLPADLPEDLPEGIAYVVPLTDPERQLDFLRCLRAAGRPTACGTYLEIVRSRPDVVRRCFELADVFFCNEHEAEALFGSVAAARTSPGRLLYVTRGPNGVRVLQGGYATHVPAVAAEERDATGAGDTFCGTVLAQLASGAHPVLAARTGVAAAAKAITEVGPSALLDPPPDLGPDARVAIDGERLRGLAPLLRDLPEVRPFDFTGAPLPPVGSETALDYFFAATLQQFGFWRLRDGAYAGPVLAPIEGRERKGSDYLWAAYARWQGRNPRALTATGQRDATPEALADACRSDDGRDVLPDLPTRATLASSYGRDALALGPTPADILARVNATARPLQALLLALDHVGGYKEDPLRKKSALLAAILSQRPERFLKPAAGERLPPIVDYHVQRTCLRLGLVRPVEAELRKRLVRREELSASDEASIRQACFAAMQALEAESGVPMGALDWFFFQNRSRCPEMSEPDCAACPADPRCAHDKELFQPVHRTTFY